MLALKFLEDRTLELVEEPEPVPARGETLLEVEVASVCGSDLHGVLPGGFRTPPLIMGHEFSGRTPQGELVAVRATYGCGECRYCTSGFEQICPQRVIIGIDRPGGFSERVVVPDRTLTPMPASADPLAGAIVEPLAVALRAWKRAEVRETDGVALIGSGTIGLLLVLVARAEGRDDVAVVDVDARRTALASRLGGRAAGSALDDAYDVIFDAVGAEATRRDSVAHLHPGGTAVWLGCAAQPSGFDALDLIRREKTVRASFAYSHDDFIEAAALAPTLDLSWIDRVDFRESATAFTAMVNKELDATKIAFQF